MNERKVDIIEQGEPTRGSGSQGCFLAFPSPTSFRHGAEQPTSNCRIHTPYQIRSKPEAVCHWGRHQFQSKVRDCQLRNACCRGNGPPRRTGVVSTDVLPSKPRIVGELFCRSHGLCPPLSQGFIEKDGRGGGDVQAVDNSQDGEYNVGDVTATPGGSESFSLTS